LSAHFFPVPAIAHEVHPLVLVAWAKLRSVAILPASKMESLLMRDGNPARWDQLAVSIMVEFYNGNTVVAPISSTI
jgi:hypothetical protein